MSDDFRGAGGQFKSCYYDKFVIKPDKEQCLFSRRYQDHPLTDRTVQTIYCDKFVIKPDEEQSL